MSNEGGWKGLVKKTNIRTVAMILTFGFGAAAVLLWLAGLGIILRDRVSQPEPVVMEPGPSPAAAGMTGLTPAPLVPRTVELTVRRVDHDRFVRTLKKDVLIHGGWTDYPGAAQQKFSVTVPAGYLERIKPLIQPPGPDAPHPDYQKWAAEVSTRPERLPGSDPVQVSFNIRREEFYNPSLGPWLTGALLASLIAMAFTAIAGVTFSVIDARMTVLRKAG